MKSSIPHIRNPIATWCWCSPPRRWQLAKPPARRPRRRPPKPPMTHSEAATECWMATEKGRADINLDKRADIVTKCIDDKMKGAKAM